MDRRDFLRGNFNVRQQSLKPQPEEITSDLSAYTEILDFHKAAHLLRRLTLGPTMELLNKIVGKTAKEAVEMILGADDAPMNNGLSELNWLDIQEEDPLDGLPLEIREEIEARLLFRYNDFVDWWLETMRSEKDYHQEKFTLFLSTIWCIEFAYDTLSLIPPPLLYRNNELLRTYRIGNYRNLAFEMALDGAMLMYQSLNFSTAAAPNENFMRELLELFTMGIGHYSEGDIREGSRTLTGWRTAAYKYKPAINGVFKTYFSPNDHDTQAKQVMGVTIPARSGADNNEFQVKEQEVKKLINILFDERPQEIASFICDKIYRYFVYSSPSKVPTQIIQEMTNTMVSNNFNLKAVYLELFTSQHFFSDEIIGCQIKTPPEFIVGFQRALNTVYKSGNVQLSRDACNQLEMELYNPPNVGSWIGYRTWLSTTTYPLRVKFSRDILSGTNDESLIELVKSLPDYTVLDKMIEGLFLLLVPIIPDDDRLSYHRNVALTQLEGSDWSSEINSGTQKAVTTIQELIDSMILIPDFNLC